MVSESVRAAEAGEVTVVIPTKNRRQLLLRALHSVLQQERVDVRVVVVDDGSDDGSAEAAQSLLDTRVLVVRNERSVGVMSARNAGLAQVRTQWVAFLDDDDFFAPNKLQSQLVALRSVPDAGWCYVGAVFVDLRARVRLWATVPAPSALEAQLLARNVIPGGGSGVLVDTALARAVGGYDESLRSAEDWDFYIRLALARPAVAVDRPLLAYTVHPGSRAFDVDALKEAYAQIETKFAAERSSRGVALDDAWWTMFLASVAWRSGERKQGLALYLRSLRRHPSLRLLLLVLTQTAPGRLRELKPILSRLQTPPAWRGQARWLRRYR